MRTEICTMPGNEPGAGEWCKEYCPVYGSGRCRYDPKIHECVVMQEDNE